MNRLRIALIVVIFPFCWLIGPGMPRANAGNTGTAPLLRVLPEDRIFPRLHASGQAHLLGIAKDLDSRQWFGDIGGERPLLGLDAGPVGIQAGIGATVHAGIIRKPPLLQVVTVDFVVDFPIDVRITEHLSVRTGYGHFSAHLADDGIEVLALRSINYAKDYVTLLGAYRLPAFHAVVYGGGRYDFHTLPEKDKHLMAQAGGEIQPVQLFTGCRLYGALDLRFKEETAWRAIQSYQIGCAFAGAGDTAIRIAWTYRTGSDDRGQFYDQTLSASLFGVYIDL
jgi:hypothetical protein